MKRRGLLKLAGFLLLGAAVNVAVAWGWALSLWRLGGVGFIFYEADSDELTWLASHGERIATQATFFHNHTGGCDRFYAYLLDTEFEASAWKKFKAEIDENPTADVAFAGTSPPFTAARVRAGWPMWSVQRYDIEHTDDWRTAHPGIAQHEVRGELRLPEMADWSVPVLPLWPGFAINTLFYAAILWGGWLPFAAPFVVRRRRRIKRGLCPACAYPVGTSEVCTECGKPVTAPKHKAQIEKAQIT